MLEIRGLKKVYKAKKGGAQVRALDGVSIRFPEKGMVFLLGKSGSGKSTLLNLCGGLDAPDEGEIVIKGRSSKDFTQSDFDSYRNTFVGFVFQEYNILNEFSVEDNIALALELQGKGRSRAQVKAILAQVDLLDFAKRKPNTLSGGQKQRVAISRTSRRARSTRTRANRYSTRSKNCPRTNWSSSSRTTANLRKFTATASSSSRTARSSRT